MEVSQKDVGNRNDLRRNGNPNWRKGGPSPNPNPPNPKRRKVASDWLTDFYHAHPNRLRKMMMRLIREAESGKNIRFLEIVVNLLEGPTKETNTGDTYNFNFLSDAEREKAQQSVKRIKAMVSKTINVLPEVSSAATISVSQPTSATGELQQGTDRGTGRSQGSGDDE